MATLTMQATVGIDGRLSLEVPGIPPGSHVSVVIFEQPYTDKSHLRSIFERFDAMRGENPAVFRTPQQIEQDLQEARDSWE